MLVDPETGRLSQSSHRAIAAAGRPRTPSARVARSSSRSCSSPSWRPTASLAPPRRAAQQHRPRATRSRRSSRECGLRGRRRRDAGARLGARGADDDSEAALPAHRRTSSATRPRSCAACTSTSAWTTTRRSPVLDHLRPWLPVLSAISVNSPFNSGRDTGHASWRSQLWGGWPTAGPAEPFGDRAGYEAATQALMDSGAAMDKGMLYLDARPPSAYPTVEMRVADVCTDVGTRCSSPASPEPSSRQWPSRSAGRRRTRVAHRSLAVGSLAGVSVRDVARPRPSADRSVGPTT